MILAREAALRHTGEDDHLPFPPTWCHTYEKADERHRQLLDFDVPFHAAA